MAIYHTRVKTFSRAKGHSAVAAAAYRAGLSLVDERTGARHDYSRRGGVVESRWVVPLKAPDWSLDAARLWQAAEAAEKRKDATVAREFEIALPHELNGPQRSALTADIARALVDRYGFAAQASIHSPGSNDGLNWHVHILATTRRLDAEGLADKTRELDGGPSGRSEVEWLRAMVAQLTNQHLAAAEIPASVDHRSLEAQAEDALERGDIVAAAVLGRRPTIHLGQQASALERRGVETDVGKALANIVADNQSAVHQTAIRFERAATDKDHAHGHASMPPNRVGLGAKLGESYIEDVKGFGRRGVLAMRTLPNAPESSLQSLMERAWGLWRDVVAAGLEGALRSTLVLLRRLDSAIGNGSVGTRVRKDVQRTLRGLAAVRRRATEWMRRVEAERRAASLLTRAERSLEDFVEQQPRPTGAAIVAWTRRRGRRLAAVEQRLDALRKARAKIEDGQEEACANQLSAAVAELETGSRVALDQLEDPVHETEDPAKLTVSTRQATPRPRLH
ncbi:MobQ family relaxase [Stenotrophomonas maltophilia]|uniref:MobQ family relaxase n=1 Tax=Stenotrophomonas maltophilia TaxID=40324 RepID=UPI0016617B15|nr:MobQ family relaxase [Stenotrophomonas maltophilia]